MCGIFGFISKEKIFPDLVFDGLKEMEYRGYDSWGIALDTDKNIIIKKHLGKMSPLPDSLPKSSIVVGHTRWATHGGITLENCHPHLDCKGKIAVVHNGIIENYTTIKQALIKKGHRFISDTDSEIIPHLIEEIGSFRPAFKKLQGLNAVAVINHNSHELIVAKNGSPLVIGVGKNINYIASDPNPLFIHTNKFIFLEDGQIAIITPDKVVVKNIYTNKIVKNNIKIIKNEIGDSSLNNYSSYLIKEISQQPEIIEKINKGYDLSALKKIYKLIKEFPQIYFTGCGTAYFAAQFNATLISQKIGKPIFCLPASELSLYNNSFDKNTLIVSFSQSGETADLINLYNLSKSKGVTMVSICNMAYSSLHRLSKVCQILPCGPEKCVLSTKSFTAKISIFMKLLDHDLAPAIKAIKTIINDNPPTGGISDLAKKLANQQHIYLIGRGMSLPIAYESALKIKEVSYIHAEAFAGAELKHGSIALVEKGTPCIVFAPSDNTYDDIISNAIEIRSRGGYIIGLADKPNPAFDYYLPIPDCGVSSCLPQVISMQLLAYYLSQIKGTDPDKPRNLAKSVTVK